MKGKHQVKSFIAVTIRLSSIIEIGLLLIIASLLQSPRAAGEDQALNTGGASPTLETWEEDIAQKEKILARKLWIGPPAGTHEKRQMPDTLNLADRGALGLNCLLGMIDYETWEIYVAAIYKTNPPYMTKSAHGGYVNVPKVIEALPEMRLMSGSRESLDIERALIGRILAMSWEDGLLYTPPAGFQESIHKPYIDSVLVPLVGRMLLAMLNWHQYDGNPIWLEQADKIYASIRDKLVRRDAKGRAFIPLVDMWGVYPRGGWPADTPELKGYPNPLGGADTIVYLLGCHVRGLARYAAYTQNDEALRLAGELARTLRSPELWMPPAQPPGMVGQERGQYSSHIHSRVAGLRGLLEYAVAANDADLKQFVRQGYEYTHGFGLPEIGWFPVGIGQAHAEVCSIVDPMMLAVELCEAGVGDYWDDVDRYARNTLVEYQFTDADRLRRACAAADPYAEIPAEDEQQLPAAHHFWRPADTTQIETNDRVIERSLGGFAANAHLTDYPAPWNYCCCNHNGMHALFWIWNGIVQEKAEGTAQVNLLMNRASQWIDVDSYLPYEGKAVIRNKTARRVHARIPGWVDKSQVQCAVNGDAAENRWLNNYLLFPGLEPGDEIVIEFPMKEYVIERTEGGSDTRYTIRFKGHTVIDIQPRAEEFMPEIRGGALVVERPVQLSVPDLVRADVTVRAQVSADGSPCAILLRYQGDWDFFGAYYDTQTDRIYFREMVNGIRTAELSPVEIGELSGPVTLTASMKRTHAEMTLSAGERTWKTTHINRRVKGAGRVGLEVSGAQQRYDDFQVLDLDGNVIYEEKFDQPDGASIAWEGAGRENNYRFFLDRDRYRSNQAPMITQSRFTPERVIDP